MYFDETLEQQEAGASDTLCAYSLVPDHKTVLTRERAVCVCVCVCVFPLNKRKSLFLCSQEPTKKVTNMLHGED